MSKVFFRSAFDGCGRRCSWFGIDRQIVDEGCISQSGSTILLVGRRSCLREDLGVVSDIDGQVDAVLDQIICNVPGQFGKKGS